MEGNGWKDQYIRDLRENLDILEERVRLLESSKDKLAGGILVLSAVGGVIGSGLVVVFQWVISRITH